MKRRKISYNILQKQTKTSILLALVAVFILTISLKCSQTQAAIVPPPWSDPEKNPCANMPGGWQLLYWAPLKQCFKIFTIGFPCPETMELSPGPLNGKSKGNQNVATAECRCPPGSALSALTNKCHRIFEKEPCEKGQYFGPLPDIGRTEGSRRLENRYGACRTPRQCPNNTVFWAKNGNCYTEYTRGPCAKGKLMVLNKEEGLAECKCHKENELSAYYYDLEETCHEHYTRGPCSTMGHLFLPGGRCDCHAELPHYYEPHQMCYELNTPGPCPPGHVFHQADEGDNKLNRASCQCKEGYVPWSNGFCYRLYTRGPCEPNQFLINATSCVQNFCGKSRLYFPDQGSCYRIGSQGPCGLHQVVVFDFTARPSVDGISFNGMCGCSGVIKNLDQKCSSAEMELQMSATGHAGSLNACESTPGMVELSGKCHKIYTRGPCGPGQWLEPLKSHLNSLGKAKCVCRPGYTASESNESTKSEESGSDVESTTQRCNAPNVGLARYLNNNNHLQQRSNGKFANQF